MGTILILSLGNTIMKVIILLCAVVAANAVPDTCQVHKNLVDKLGKEASKHYPAGAKGDGVCEEGEGFTCIGEISSAVFTCATSPNILTCIQGIIDSASDCYDCICWVVSYLGYECPE